MERKLGNLSARVLAVVLLVISLLLLGNCKGSEHDHADSNKQELTMLPLETVSDTAEYRRWLMDLPQYSQGYDPDRNPKADLEVAGRAATESGKLIFMLIGGDWCSWCHVMTKFFSQEKVLQQLLLDNYEFLKINMSETNPNKEFLAGYPEIHGYPHIFILSPSGELLHSQDPSELEQNNGYSSAKFAHFLKQFLIAK